MVPCCKGIATCQRPEAITDLCKEFLVWGSLGLCVGDVFQFLLHRFIQVVCSFVFLSDAADDEDEENDEAHQNENATDDYC